MRGDAQGERRALDVWLGDVPVGRLALLADGRCTFVFFPSYDERYPRPVLGQAFEEDRSAGYESRGRLPAFFANLLPEGPLRRLIGDRLSERRRHEIHLLREVGEDLPGAVRVTAALGPDPPARETTLPGGTAGPPSASPLRFSLAGVQLKFSVLRGESGALTVPASGVGGDWIVKLPDATFEAVPRNEHAMMTWAALAGLDVPPIDLAPKGSVQGIDPRFFARDEDAFVIRRFDRAPGGRVHIEDFAQVLDVYPDAKYDRAGYDQLAAFVRGVCGDDDFRELVRRLVFSFAIGNTDAHLKNFSLRYPDGVTARLAPAYDLVSVLPYLGPGELALRIAGSRKWKDLYPASFERLADAASAPRAAVRALVDETLDRIAKAAPAARAQTRFSADGWRAISEHWKQVPLFKGRPLVTA